MPTPGGRPTAVSEQYVDAKTAAARLNLPLSAIYRLVKAGELAALRVPIRIRSDDLNGVLDRCRVKPGDLRHLNQYSGRPASDVAAWFRSKSRIRREPT